MLFNGGLKTVGQLMRPIGRYKLQVQGLQYWNFAQRWAKMSTNCILSTQLSFIFPNRSKMVTNIPKHNNSHRHKNSLNRGKCSARHLSVTSSVIPENRRRYFFFFRKELYDDRNRLEEMNLTLPINLVEWLRNDKVSSTGRQ